LSLFQKSSDIIFAPANAWNIWPLILLNDLV